MAAPTYVGNHPATSSTNWTTTTSPKTCTFTPGSGNILALLACTEDAATTISAPTGGLTWTLAQANATASNVANSAYTASGAGSANTPSVARGSTVNSFGFDLFEFSGSAGVGASNKATSQTGTHVTLAVTTTQANSALVVIICDWNAGAVGSDVYDQVNSASPVVISSAVEGGNYTLRTLYYADAGAIGSKTVGVTSGASQKASLIVVEIKGTASGTDYTPSQADPVGITDALVSGANNVRAQSDAVGLVDALLPGQDNVRAQVDSVGLTDALSPAQVIARTQLEAVGITDSAIAVSGPTRQQADPVGLTDLLAATQVLIRSLADPVGLTDTATPAQVMLRQQNDAVGVTDSASAAQSQSVTTSDSVGITDSASGVITPAGGSYTEYPGFLDTYYAGLTDGNDTSLVSAATLVEVIGRSDVYALGADLFCPVSAGTAVTVQLQSDVDSNGGFDTVEASIVSASIVSATKLQVRWTTPVLMTASKFYMFTVFCDTGQQFRYGFKSHEFDSTTRPSNPSDYLFPGGITGVYFIPDGTSLTPGNGAFSGTNQFPNSSFNATDYGVTPVVGLASSGTNYTANPADPEGITDAAAANADNVRAIADQVGLLDLVVSTQTLVRLATDPVGLTDSASAAISSANTQSVVDPEGVTDTLSATQGTARTVADPVGITDSAAAVLAGQNYAVTVNDTIGVTDAGAQQTIDYTETVADPVGVTDSATPVLVTGGTNYAPSVADPVGLTDNATPTQAIARVQSDAVGITDSATAVLTPAGSSVVTDPEGITDQLTPVQAQFVSPSDPIGVTDVLTASSAFLRALADSVGLTDSVAASLGLLRTLSDAVGIADLLTASLVHTPVNYTVAINDPIGITDSASSANPARDLDLDIMMAAQRWLVTIDALRWEVR